MSSATAALPLVSEIDALALQSPPQTPDAPAEAETDKPERPSAATKLVQLALSKYRLGVTEDGDAFATPLDGPGHIARMLRSGMRGSLRSALAADFFDIEHKAAPQAALTDALNVLEGKAERLEPEPLHLRVARQGNTVWIDIGDAEGTAIEVTSTGWRFATQVPVMFRRTELTSPLPLPRYGGKFERVWEFLNVAPDDRATLLAFLVAAFIPDIPHPILTLAGEQGTGKSTTARMLGQLVDPSPAQLRKPPRDADGFSIALAGSWVGPIDNLSTMPDWLSDALCRAVTGDGDVRRKLWSDSALSVTAFRRVIILTGIDFAGLRGDLTERMLMVNLHRIDPSKRKDDRDLTRAWEDARRDVLGGLLDHLSTTLAALPTTSLERAPRMADFARVLAALDAANGTDGLTRYAQQSVEIAADTLTASPFIARLTALPLDFTGTAAELLARVTPPEPDWKPPRDWPKNARAATTALKRHAPALRAQGWTVDDIGEDRTHSRRWLVLAPAAESETLLARPSGQ